MEQAKLVKEAESSMRQQEIEALQNQWEAEIQHAVGQAVLEYWDQLSVARNDLQQKYREHQQSIQKLQDQVCALELSLAGQATLPSVAASSSRTGYARKFLILFQVQLTNVGELLSMRARTRPSRSTSR